MRILAIGLGGAGCRIAASLYTTDRRSSRVACVQALAIDVDGDTLAKLGDLPESAKVYFPALEAGALNANGDLDQTATVDIGEIIARIQNVESGEIDAIFICCGLGGSMANIAPHIVTALRASIVEPIFGLFTLPCLSEGEKRSAKAADDIEMLSPLLDGVILFDNETWSKKISAARADLVKREKGGTSFFGLGKARQEISPEDAARMILNEGIVRRISLILRAGEFKADGGIDLAEVVMDSGEVLNTMKGMGFITIGYAVEHLPQHPFGFLSRWRPVSYFAEEHKKKASRIVELAKQAIYNEVSTPCDITSAAKALVLVAGPSHELSMKGFMTVRKWIDRSIAGLETRSGDYPVTNTKYVAIIVMLSGLENIPRLAELNEIRTQYSANLRGDSRFPMSRPSDQGFDVPDALSETPSGDAPPAHRFSGGKDAMISLPGKKSPVGRFDDARSGEITRQADMQESPVGTRETRDREISQDIPPLEMSVPAPDEPHIAVPVIEQPVPPAEKPAAQPPGERAPTIRSTTTLPRIPRRHLVVSKEEKRVVDTVSEKAPAVPLAIPPKPPVSQVPAPAKRQVDGGDPSLRAREDLLKKREQERLRIESELQRQRMMAISGHMQKKPQVKKDLPHHVPSISPAMDPHRLVRPEPRSPGISVAPKPDERHIPEKRTVLITRKRNNLEEPAPTRIPDTEPAPAQGEKSDPFIISTAAPVESALQESQIALKDQMKHSNDEIFTGKGIPKRSPSQANDSVLLRAGLKLKKSQPDVSTPPPAQVQSREEPPRTSAHLIKKRVKKPADEDETGSGA